MTRPSFVEVDLDAIAYNAAVLAEVARPARLCAVVKADGYGHGAVPAARAALAGGADMLGVAMVEEGAELRSAGLDAPILVLGPQADDSMSDAVTHRLELMVSSVAELRAISAAHRQLGGGNPSTRVHLLVDSGMRRAGVEPRQLASLRAEAARLPGIEPVAVATHFARADEPTEPTTDLQLARFEEALTSLDLTGNEIPMIHAANSAATITRPDARFDLVRCGISLYGLAPSPQLESNEVVRRLRPALRVLSAVSLVKAVPAGEGVSYGHHRVTDRPTMLGVVPIGYGDGVPRGIGLDPRAGRAASNGQPGVSALVGGVRRPILGAVTMDQLVLDCTDGPSVGVGDEVVLLGAQPVASQSQTGLAISPTDWAGWMGTINYEIVTRLGARLPRRYLGVASDGELS